MSEETDLTNEQVDAFFESKGEAIPEGFDDKDGAHEEAKDSQPELEAKPSIDVEKLSEKAENYKRALAEERAQRQEMQRKLQELESKLSPQEPQEVEPDDPIDALTNKLSKLEQQTAEQQENQRKMEELNQFQSRVISSEQQFSESHPDYKEAVNFLIQSREAELKILGASDEAIADTLSKEGFAIAAFALQNGANPAEAAYNLAKQRGYVAKLDQKIAETSQRMDSIERGVSASMSLGQASSVSDADISLESFAHLDGPDLLNAVSNPDVWNQLSGKC